MGPMGNPYSGGVMGAGPKTQATVFDYLRADAQKWIPFQPLKQAEFCLDFAEAGVNSGAQVIIRTLTGGTGSCADAEAEGFGALTATAGASAGLGGFDTYGSGGYRTLRNGRGRWYLAGLVRTPDAPNASSRMIALSIMEGTTFTGAGIVLFGAVSTTTWRIGSLNLNTLTLNTTVPSTKTQANTTGAPGDFKLFRLRCDGVRIYGSVDGEAWINAAPATDIAVAKAVLRTMTSPLAGVSPDRMIYDAMYLYGDR